MVTHNMKTSLLNRNLRIQAYLKSFPVRLFLFFSFKVILMCSTLFKWTKLELGVNDKYILIQILRQKTEKRLGKDEGKVL
jgi:hypothetical protein